MSTLRLNVSHPMLFAAAVLLGLFFAFSVRAADDGAASDKDKEKDAETKQLEEEDKNVRNESGKSWQLNSNFEGKFTKFTPAQIAASNDPSVIGKFDAEGESMLVRPMDDKIKEELIKKDGQSMVINGRQRLNNKYLYAFRIMPVTAGNTYVAPAGGL